MTIKRVSLNTIIIYFEQRISEDILDQVQQMNSQLKELNGMVDIIPSYCSILVTYDRRVYNNYKDIKNLLGSFRNTKQTWESSVLPNLQVTKIPTDYSKNLDLERVAQYNNLTIDDVITIHSKRVYRVYAIGFMVGFAYLAQVDKKIATPRLSTPRAKVPKGSVAIADTQTAIYPQDSAGGWNIIGTTEFNSFEQFSIGDYVQFTRI